MNTQTYNLVILPTSPTHYQCSATSRADGHRMVSPSWSEPELFANLARIDLTPGQIHELIRGNRMLRGGRDSAYQHFSRPALASIGLSESDGKRSET